MQRLLCLLAFLTSPAFAEYTAVYSPAQTAADVPIATQFREERVLENLAGLLNQVVRVNRTIPLVATSCGTPNAFYSSSQRSITLCYELISDNAKRLAKMFSPQQSRQIGEILASELIFILLHEAGHGLVDEYQLPVLGREEDAADKFATFVLLSLDKEQMLKQASLFFYTNKPKFYEKLLKGPGARYGDEHGLAEQRLANLVCWGFGKSPNNFNQMATSIQLPQSRLNRCADEYTKLDRDIRSLLGDKLGLGQQLAQQQVYASAATPVESQGPAAPLTGDVALDGWTLAKRHNCVMCHLLDDRVIGPPFRDVARRYRGSDAEAMLVSRVRYGSTGVWGQVPAPPNPGVPEQDLRLLMQWVLSL